MLAFLLVLFVKSKPHCPLNARANLWTPSTTSSSCDLPNANAITLFLPKKNRLSFHSALKSFNLLLRILSTETRKISEYFSTQFLTSSTICCFKTRPFLLVFVSDTAKYNFIDYFIAHTSFQHTTDCEVYLKYYAVRLG